MLAVAFRGRIRALDVPWESPKLWASAPGCWLKEEGPQRLKPLSHASLRHGLSRALIQPLAPLAQLKPCPDTNLGGQASRNSSGFTSLVPPFAARARTGPRTAMKSTYAADKGPSCGSIATPKP